ncbi:hypothetical protein SLEP1_g13779 [Rubroshorea leprosula]|uniref:Uncharacterized protein n=1 Tax=Rubroshorea leprosula TaxID=152421 RepID=A0AAV5ISL0_9ROSI|nr:hypothetical protein SLEP1_g13779 [Rubroshorea leprosula]
MQICSTVVALFCAATLFGAVEAAAVQWRKGRKMSCEGLERLSTVVVGGREVSGGRRFALVSLLQMDPFIHALLSQLSRILLNKLKEEFCAIRGVKHDLETLKKYLHTIDRELETAAVKDKFHANTLLWLLRLMDKDKWEYRQTQLRKSAKLGLMKFLSKVKYY